MTGLNVIKVGGKIVEDPMALDNLISSFAAMKGLKVLVHGGGRTATDLASRLGIESRMVNGRRITDAATLKLVTMVYAGLINKDIVARLQAAGVDSTGLTGADMNCILSRKRPVTDVDYGYVGDVEKVDSDVLSKLLSAGIIPVIAPLTHDGKGTLLNTNADTIASEVAVSLSSRFDVTLTFCFEKKGVLARPDDDDSVIPVIDKQAFAKYKAYGTIRGGMIPKLENAFAALEAGVGRVVITEAGELGMNNGTVVKL
jgi:acetylglutamate kinase